MLLRSLLFSLLILYSPPAHAGRFWRMCGAPLRWVGILPQDAPAAAASPLLSRLSSIELGRRLGAGGQGEVHMATAVAVGETDPFTVIVKSNTPRFAGPDLIRKAEAELTTEAEGYNKVHPGEAVLIRQDGELVMVQRIFPASAEAKDRNKPAVDVGEFFIVHPDRANDRPFKEAASLAALENLDLIHARKLNHNDIKPANLLLSRDGKVRIIDYGIVTASGADLASGKGTLAYLSPRRLNGASDVVPRDDVHAMGLTLLELELGAKMEEMRGYAITRKFASSSFTAWGRVPDDMPRRISPERAMAHFTSAKQTTKDYRALLKAAEDPAAFKKEFAKQWVKAYELEDAGLKDYLIYELYLSPKLGPELVKAMPKKYRDLILARGREMKPNIAANEGMLSWVGWHKEMGAGMDEFLGAF